MTTSRDRAVDVPFQNDRGLFQFHRPTWKDNPGATNPPSPESRIRALFQKESDHD